MAPDQSRRLGELEAENGQLKKIVAHQVLDIDTLKALLAKNRKPISQASGCSLSDIVQF
jgi:hypothetical protein